MNPETHKQLVLDRHNTIMNNMAEQNKPEPGKRLVILACGSTEQKNVFVQSVYKEKGKRNRTIDLSNGKKLYEYKSKGVTRWTNDKKSKPSYNYAFWKHDVPSLPKYDYMYTGRLMNIITGNPVFRYEHVARVVEPGYKTATIEYGFQNTEAKIVYENGIWNKVRNIDMPREDQYGKCIETVCD